MDNSSTPFEEVRYQAAQELARLGAAGRFQLVAAESCTGGLVAASLTAIPGASQWFCGSSVVYQASSKFAWLDISKKLVDMHSAESAEVTTAMSRAILDLTSHANLSLATTGHLEPDSQRANPSPYVFVSISKRSGDMIESNAATEMPLSGVSRPERQQEAAAIAMQKLLDFLQALTSR